jgi:autotransporter-associated beta strand protein
MREQEAKGEDAMANDTFNGAFGSDWFNVINWLPAQPGTFDDAFITDLVSAVIDGNNGSLASVNSIEVGGGGNGNMLTVDNGAELDVGTQISIDTGFTNALVVNSGGIVKVANGTGTIILGATVAAGSAGFGDLIFGGLPTFLGGAGPSAFGAGAVDANVVLNTFSSRVIFDATDSLTYSGVISGPGLEVDQNGTGTVTLTGASTYSGATNITGGVLEVDGTGTLGTGAVTLTNATLTFNQTNTYHINNTISGSGLVNFVGTGVSVIGADNSYSGTTIISNGIVQVGDSGSTGSLGSGLIIDNGAIYFAHTNAFVFANSILGSGGVQQFAGTATLSGSNTYTGGTFVNAGVLQAGAAGAFSSFSAFNISSGAFLDLAGFSESIGALSGAGTVNNSSFTGATLTEINSASSTFSGLIQNGLGVLSISKLGAGTLILSSANTYTGTTTISAGTLQIGSGGTTGTTGTGAITDNAALSYNRSGNLSVGQAISGSGSVSFSGGGVFTLTGSNTYQGVTTIGSGTIVSVSNNLTIGSLGTGAVTDNGELDLARSDTTTVANAISGSGAVKQIYGVTTLTGANSYTGATTVTSGTLQIGNGGTTGTLGTGAVTNNATLTFNRSNTYTIGNAISGSGAVNFNGTASAFYQFTANNSYGGPTTIAAGVSLSVGDGQSGHGGTLGSSAVTDNGVLYLDRFGANTFANSISGAGSVIQYTGTATMTGANSYSGGTTVHAGTLIAGATNTLGSGAVTVNAQTTLDLDGFSESVASAANSGTVTESTGTSTLTAVSLTNNGVLSSTGGSLFINSAVSGTGSAVISGGGFLGFFNAFNQNVAFQGAGTLGLSQAYGGVISNFATGANVDLTNVSFAAGEHMVFQSIANGVQTYALADSGNNVLATLSFSGHYSANLFQVQQDSATGALISLVAPPTPAVSDYDPNGVSDLLWQNQSTGDVYEWQMSSGQQSGNIYLGNLSGWSDVGAGYFYGAGAAAGLLWQNQSTGDVYEWQMSGGQHTGTDVYLGNLSGWSEAGVGDFNGDGASDLLWQNNSTGDVYEWQMSGGQHTGTDVYIGNLAGWKEAGVGDFYGNGGRDLLWQNQSTGDVYEWQMSGGQHSGSDVYLGNLSGWSEVGVGDFYGNGTSDLLWQNKSTGDVYEWQMSSGQHTGNDVYLGNLSGWGVVGTGDYTGNGVSNIIWQNQSSGATYEWTMTNGQHTGDIFLGNVTGWSGK